MSVAQGFCGAGRSEYLATLEVRSRKSSIEGGLRLKDSLARHPAEAMLRVMRKRFEVQLALGRTPIEKVVLPAPSRDEKPPVLAGRATDAQKPSRNEPHL